MTPAQIKGAAACSGPAREVWLAGRRYALEDILPTPTRYTTPGLPNYDNSVAPPLDLRWNSLALPKGFLRSKGSLTEVLRC